MHSRPPASRATRSPGASFRQRRRDGVVDAAIMGAPAAAYDFGFGDIFEYWYAYMPFYYFPMTLVHEQGGLGKSCRQISSRSSKSSMRKWFPEPRR